MTAADVRAPQGAVAWSPAEGWLFDDADLPTRVVAGDFLLVVSERDGMVRIESTDTAPLAAVLRVDADVTELVLRLNDIAEHVAQRLSQRDGGAS